MSTTDCLSEACTGTAETFAIWLRRQGHSVLRTRSTYWHSEGWGVYQQFPYHQLIEPSAEELDYLFFDKRVMAVRYSEPITTDPTVMM